MDRDTSSTSPWEYVDFELEIRKGNGPKYPVVVRSPAGEAQAEMHFPFGEQELQDKLKDLENAVLLSSTRRRRIRSPEAQTVQDFGRKLFQALLSDQVGAHYDESLRKARRQNKGLRLKLSIQPPELTTVPWEFLYDPNRNSYLCLSSKTPLVRYPELREPIEQLPVTPPLRILGMVASPYDLPRLKVEKEKRRVKEAVRDLEEKGRVKLTWLEGQTSRDLLRAMRHGPWHVFHFIGHGDFDPDSNEGLIALADEEDNARFLRAEDLAQLLADHWDLRLVLLNSCEGARGSEHDAFSSTAATLVRPGIPAVLANQYEISDEAAVEFSSAFYEAVADGLPLDAAVAGARTSLKIEIGDTLEWGTPVLYMRSPDGRIFDISTQAPPAELTQEEPRDRQEEDLLRRYRECAESVWVDGELHSREAEWLSDYANNELGLSPSAAADIEREVMGDTKEAILERQERAAREAERQERLAEFYARARRLHRDQEWQAVVEVFDQIRAVDPEYPDTEELLASAREELAAREELMRKVAAAYDQGQRHMKAGEWEQALERFEEVQRLEPGYRDTETLLSRVQDELAKPPTVEVPDLSGQNASQASSALAEAEQWLSKRDVDPSQLEREFIDASRTHEQQEAARKEYRRAVAEAWADRKLDNAEVERLSELANNRLRLSPNTAASIEGEVMGNAKEAVLERQNQLDELYAQAHRLHQDQKWQAVVDVFDQVHAIDPEYPDTEELLASAREELAAREELMRKVAAAYDQGQRHMKAGEWEQALERFEEVQRLEPGYRDTETLLSWVRHELVELTARHDDLGGWGRNGSPPEKPDSLPGEQESKLDRPPDLPGW